MAWVAKFAPGGQTLQYSTLLPGSGLNTIVNAFAVDPAGDAVLGGGTESPDLALVHPLSCCSVTSTASNGEGFATELDPSGSSLVFSSYLSPGTNQVWALGFDTSQNLYVSGQANPTSTAGSAFPSLLPVQPCHENSGNAFAMKILPASGTLAYATCLGGSTGGDQAVGLAVDAANNLYLHR